MVGSAGVVVGVAFELGADRLYGPMFSYVVDKHEQKVSFVNGPIFETTDDALSRYELLASTRLPTERAAAHYLSRTTPFAIGSRVKIGKRNSKHRVLGYQGQGSSVLITWGRRDLCWWPSRELHQIDDIQYKLFVEN